MDILIYLSFYTFPFFQVELALSFYFYLFLVYLALWSTQTTIGGFPNEIDTKISKLITYSLAKLYVISCLFVFLFRSEMHLQFKKG